METLTDKIPKVIWWYKWFNRNYDYYFAIL